MNELHKMEITIEGVDIGDAHAIRDAIAAALSGCSLDLKVKIELRPA